MPGLWCLRKLWWSRLEQLTQCKRPWQRRQRRHRAGDCNERGMIIIQPLFHCFTVSLFMNSTGTVGLYRLEK